MEKNIIISEDIIISRLINYDAQADAADIQLSEAQNTAFQSIKQNFETNSTVLLHGVTGSGKTEIYIKLIDEVLKTGEAGFVSSS